MDSASIAAALADRDWPAAALLSEESLLASLLVGSRFVSSAITGVAACEMLSCARHAPMASCTAASVALDSWSRTLVAEQCIHPLLAMERGCGLLITVRHSAALGIKSPAASNKFHAPAPPGNM